jgi:crossover junction endonuclease MUS81
MLKILIDCREHKLCEAFTTQDCVEQKQLDIGDLQVWWNDELYLTIERKTIADLNSSILDGRYREQKCRMIANSNKILYLLEGDLKSYDTKSRHIKYKVVYGAIWNMILRDGFSIIKTANIKETINIIDAMIRKISKKGIPTSKDETLKSQHNKTMRIHKKKCANLTQNLCLINQLCCIPQISHKVASAIVNKYPTMKLLLDALENNQEWFQNLKINNRKINKNIIINLNKFML